MILFRKCYGYIKRYRSLIDFEPLTKHPCMIFDVKREELKYLFCTGETRKKNNVRPIFISTIFATRRIEIRRIEKEAKGSSVEEEAEETQR